MSTADITWTNILHRLNLIRPY